jgi:NTP pyrophosphatase (non-canonical NTP hydrolase)
MNFAEYQKNAYDLALPQSRSLQYMILGIANESGEVAGKYKKFLRGDFDNLQLRSDLLAELGDVLWYIAGAAREMGIDLETIALHNITKLRDRAQRGVRQGNGDNR